MTELRPTDQDVNRAIRSWLHEDRHEDASRVAGAVLDRVEATPQRRATWWPARRMPNVMNKFATLGLGAAAVVVALVVGMQFLPASGGLGGAPAASPSASPTPTPTPTPQATVAAPSASAATAPTPQPLTQSFTSTQHGISLSYPQGWTVRPATEPWTDRPGEGWFLHPGFDVLYDPVLDGELSLWITSRPIGVATPGDWLAARMADNGCSATEPITVDGATGLIGAAGCHESAAVTTAGRGYEIGLYTPHTGEGGADPSYDRAWFEEVLATVQFHPEDAVGAAPSATP